MTNDVFMMKTYIEKLKEGSKCIVYCKTRKDTEAISEKLKRYKVKVSHYMLVYVIKKELNSE